MKISRCSARAIETARRLGVRACALVFLGLAAVLATAHDSRAATVPVKLDPSFGVNGRTITDIGGPGHEDEAFDMVMQPDGKLVTAGKAFNTADGDFDFAVMRYNTDGSLDASFGAGGIVLTDFLGGHDEADGIDIQPDGKLVVSGYATNPANGQQNFALARYQADGSLDTSFGLGGLVTTDFFGGNDEALGVRVQADGRIVAGGWTTRQKTGMDFALARYSPNGRLDPTYGIGGLVTTDFFGSTDAAHRITLQPDGKAILVGTALNPKTGNMDFAIVRYTVNGTPDAALSAGGTAGRITTDFLGGPDFALAVTLQANGQILVGGIAYSPYTRLYDFALARYNPDGSLDQNFSVYGKRGMVTTDFFGLWDEINGLAIQPDGKILAAGHAQHPVRSYEYALARYNADGTLDTTFGYGGLFTMDFFNGPDGIHSLVLQPDGKAVVAGDVQNPAHESDDVALVRLLLVDPSWIKGFINGLPPAAFADAGAKTSIIAALDNVQAEVTAGDTTGALTALGALRATADGCPPSPDGTDLIIDCGAQAQFRTLIDQLIAKLGG